MSAIKATSYYAEGAWVAADYGGQYEPEGLFQVTVERNAQAVADEWNALLARAVTAEAQVQRVSELHWPRADMMDDRVYTCGHCGQPWPCRTQEALDEDGTQ